MAKVGAPKGNDNSAVGCRLKHELTKRLQKKKEAEMIVDALVAKAQDGDVSAIKEVFDRSGGKASQSVEVSGGDTPLVHTIKREIVDNTNNSDS